MLLTILVILVVSAALVTGAAWGAYGKLPPELEGLIVALAGGALIVSAVLELIDPATKIAPFWAVAACVLAGAAAFAGLDVLVKQKFARFSSPTSLRPLAAPSRWFRDIRSPRYWDFGPPPQCCSRPRRLPATSSSPASLRPRSD